MAAHHANDPSPAPLPADNQSCLHYTQAVSKAAAALLVATVQARTLTVDAAASLVDGTAAYQDAQASEFDPILKTEERKLQGDLKNMVNDLINGDTLQFATDGRAYSADVNGFDPRTAGCR